MKIYHILNAPVVGGCEKLAHYFITATPEHKHEVIFIDSSEGGMREAFRLLTTSHSLRIHSGVGCKFLKSIKNQKDNALAIVWVGSNLPSRLNALRDFCGDVLCHVGNPVVSKWVELKFSVLSWFLSAPKKTTIVCCSDHVLSSVTVAKYYSSFKRLMIYNGVKSPLELDVVKNRIRDSSMRKESGLARFLYVGRIDVIKDLKSTLVLFSLLLQKGCSDFIFEIIGDGKKKDVEIIKKQIIDLGLSDYVLLRGVIDNPFRTASDYKALLFPVTDKEGFGLVAAESFLSGIPVISKNIGPCKDFRSDGLPLYIEIDSWSDESTVRLMIDIINGEMENALKETSLRANDFAIKNFSIEKMVASYFSALSLGHDRD